MVVHRIWMQIMSLMIHKTNYGNLKDGAFLMGLQPLSLPPYMNQLAAFWSKISLIWPYTLQYLSAEAYSFSWFCTVSVSSTAASLGECLDIAKGSLSQKTVPFNVCPYKGLNPSTALIVNANRCLGVQINELCSTGKDSICDNFLSFKKAISELPFPCLQCSHHVGR